MTALTPNDIIVKGISLPDKADIEMYNDIIPNCNTGYWLKDMGNWASLADAKMLAYPDNRINEKGKGGKHLSGIRPILYARTHLQPGEYFVLAGIEWIVLSSTDCLCVEAITLSTSKTAEEILEDWAKENMLI